MIAVEFHRSTEFLFPSKLGDNWNLALTPHPVNTATATLSWPEQKLGLKSVSQPVDTRDGQIFYARWWSLSQGSTAFKI